MSLLLWLIHNAFGGFVATQANLWLLRLWNNKVQDLILCKTVIQLETPSNQHKSTNVPVSKSVRRICYHSKVILPNKESIVNCENVTNLQMKKWEYLIFAFMLLRATLISWYLKPEFIENPEAKKRSISLMTIVWNQKNCSIIHHLMTSHPQKTRLFPPQRHLTCPEPSLFFTPPTYLKGTLRFSWWPRRNHTRFPVGLDVYP